MCFSHCLLSLNNVHIVVPQFYYNIIYLLNFKVLICPLPLLLYVNNIIGVNCVDLYVVTHMFVIIIRHYKGIHSATGGSLTAFYYPLCCISSAPCYSCVFQHLARYIDVQQNSPLPSGDAGYLLSGSLCCDFGRWFCIDFGSSVVGSTERVFSQDSIPHVVFPPCYQLPGVLVQPRSSHTVVQQSKCFTYASRSYFSD